MHLRVGEKDPLSNIRGLGGGLGPLKLTSQNVLQFETHILGDNLERKRDVKNDYINLSYEALFDQNNWPIEILCTGINEYQNHGANFAEYEIVFSAKE